jgi:hypothetical protein
MAEHQIVGDQQPLDKKVTDPPTHRGPNPNAQLIGDHVPLGRNPVHPPTHTKTQGQVQQIGDGVPLSQAPVLPMGSQANLPMSTLSNYPAGRKGKE